jgi:hypothetical protein
MNYFINTGPLINSGDELLKKPEPINTVAGGSITKLSKKPDFINGETKHFNNPSNLFRLYLKNNEYAYARPNDIVVIESYDHLVKVYLAFGNTVKKTIRKNTLKDFLLLLPEDQFMRIGRFCAINMDRLSGGNCKNQTFEFDFSFSVKLSHPISNTIFNSIGK